MNTVRLYKKPTKGLKILALSSPFVAIGFWMLDRDISSSDRIMAYCLIGFFGLGILVALFHLLDRRPQIRIDEKGIWDRTTGLDRIDWKFIKSANAITIYRVQFIALRLDEDYENAINQHQWVAATTNPFGAEKVNLGVSQIAVDPNKLAAFIKKMAQLTEEERRKELLSFKS